MTHYVNFGLPSNKSFVTVALKHELSPDMYVPLKRAVTTYVKGIMECFLFGHPSMTEVRSVFDMHMLNLKVAGVELAQRTQIGRESREAICANVPFYDFMIVDGDEFTRRTLLHAAYESIPLRTVTEFLKTWVEDCTYSNEQRHALLNNLFHDAMSTLVSRLSSRNRPHTMEFSQERVFNFDDTRNPLMDRRRYAVEPEPSFDGYRYHFYAPTHNFQITISSDFRNLHMKTCRVEEVDLWLPDSVHPVLH